MEHRWGCRISTDFAVRLVALPATIGTGRMLNVSQTGAFVQTSVACPVLSVVYVELVASPATAFGLSRIAACLVRRSAGGVGLEWCDLAPDAVDQLLTVVREQVPQKSPYDQQPCDAHLSRA